MGLEPVVIQNVAKKGGRRKRHSPDKVGGKDYPLSGFRGRDDVSQGGPPPAILPSGEVADSLQILEGVFVDDRRQPIAGPEVRRFFFLVAGGVRRRRCCGGRWRSRGARRRCARGGSPRGDDGDIACHRRRSGASNGAAHRRCERGFGRRTARRRRVSWTGGHRRQKRSPEERSSPELVRRLGAKKRKRQGREESKRQGKEMDRLATYL